MSLLWRLLLLARTGALGDKDDKEDKKSESADEEDPEIAEARREAEERRNEKYRKMEEEREIMRQGIREKVSTITSRVSESWYCFHHVFLCVSVCVCVSTNQTVVLKTRLIVWTTI